MTWSGDVGNDFGTLRRQIAGGLGQMASGLPWWTFDAGGFFRPGDQYTSAEYQERLIRWVQTSTFLPFMRVHGYMSQTEPWHYFPETYEIIASYMDLRKRLEPYILDCAKRVSQEGYTLIRPLVFDFPDDPEALRQDDTFMFGPAYLVHPVTAPGVTSWRTYLPATEGGWRDYWTGTTYEGGQWVETPVDLATIPVFVRGGLGRGDAGAEDHDFAAGLFEGLARIADGGFQQAGGIVEEADHLAAIHADAEVGDREGPDHGQDGLLVPAPQGGHHGHGEFGNGLVDGVRILQRIDVRVEADVILSIAEDFKDFLHTHKSYSSPANIGKRAVSQKD